MDNGTPPFSHYNIYVLYPTGEEIIYTRSRFDEAIDDTARKFNIAGLFSVTTQSHAMTALPEALGMEGESVQSCPFVLTTENAG